MLPVKPRIRASSVHNTKSFPITWFKKFTPSSLVKISTFSLIYSITHPTNIYWMLTIYLPSTVSEKKP